MELGPPAPSPWRTQEVRDTDYIKIGKITHYFDKIGIAVLVVSEGKIKVGDRIRIGEFENGIEQNVDSMQVNINKSEKQKLEMK